MLYFSTTVGRWNCHREVVGATIDRITIKCLLFEWVTACLQTRKPHRYIINTKINSAIHPSGVGKSRTGLSGRGWDRVRSPMSDVR